MKFLVVLALAVVTLADSNIDCGRTPIAPEEVLIVGGKIAKAYSWPWQVEMCTNEADGKCHLRCGGTVIDKQWVMSAGHCVDGYTDQPGLFGIKAGTFNYHDDNEPEEQIFKILEIHLHPNYSKPVEFAHDMSLLKLDREIKYGKHVQPVCVPSSVKNLVHKGKSAYVTGWGAISEGGPVSAQLRQVVVPFLDMSACEAEYGMEIDPITMECAGRKGVDSCQGDSGGPLVTKHQDNGRWYQAGIVSWGNGCAEAREAGVYSRPSSMCDFIHSTLKKEICRSI